MPRNRPRTTNKAAWNEEDLLNARTAVERGMSKRKAAKTHNIPFTTLRDRDSPEIESDILSPIIPSYNTPSSKDTATTSPVPGKSTQNEQQLAHVAFSDIARTPTVASTSKSFQKRRKQHATLLTATPIKRLLEEKENRKKAKKDKTEKNIKSKEATKGKKGKGKSYKRKVFVESSTESEREDNICDDDRNYDMEEDDECTKCNICQEFGKSNEVWYRCTLCGFWSHAMCSGWDSAEGYSCDLCTKA